MPAFCSKRITIDKIPMLNGIHKWNDVKARITASDLISMSFLVCSFKSTYQGNIFFLVSVQINSRSTVELSGKFHALMKSWQSENWKWNVQLHLKIYKYFILSTENCKANLMSENHPIATNNDSFCYEAF